MSQAFHIKDTWISDHHLRDLGRSFDNDETNEIIMRSWRMKTEKKCQIKKETMDDGTRLKAHADELQTQLFRFFFFQFGISIVMNAMSMTHWNGNIESIYEFHMGRNCILLVHSCDEFSIATPIRYIHMHIISNG